MYKFATRKIFLRYFGLLVLFMSLALQTVYAEGSKDLIRNGGNRAFLEHRTNGSSTAGIPRRTVIRVYANAGEVVALGSSANGVGNGAINVRGPSSYTFSCPTPGAGDTGKILNRTQEVAGANYNGTEPDGYTPCTFTAPSDGIYEVDFVQPTVGTTNPPPTTVGENWSPQAATDNWVTAWDVTVFDGNVAQEGRVFARYYALNLGAGNVRVNLDVYVQTIDGYRYRLEQDIEPFGFIFFANRKGFRSDTTGDALYRSIQLNNDDTLQAGQDFNAPDEPDNIPNNEVTHKIFLNEPDGSMPATAATPSGSTWLYRADAKAPPIPQDFAFTGVDGTQDQAGTGLGGTFSFVNPLDGTDDAPAPNAYNITLEFSSGATKRVLAGTADPDVTTEVFWDGKDGDGNDVPAGQGDFIATVRLFSGEVHFPFLDVEDAPTGITIRRLNTPTGSSVTGIADPGRIYYDDSIFTNGQRELDGIITPPAAHTFTGDFGNHRGIDTWVYYPTAEPEQASIVIREADLAVAMTDDPDPVLPGGPISYTFTVSNLSDGSAGTVDAVDAAITDTFPAELTNVQWRCDITTEGTFADEPLAASSCAVDSDAGDINTTVNLKRGATATFTVTATVDQGASGDFTNTATVTRGDDASDPNEGNNEANETTTVDEKPGIAGTVFDDANGNGVFDSGESGLAGVGVVIHRTNNDSCRVAITNAAGDYVFTDVETGDYQIIEASSETTSTLTACPPAAEDPAGYRSTTPNIIIANGFDNDSLFAQNFGDATGFDYGDAPATYTEADVVASDSIYLGSTPPDVDAGNWHDGTDDSQNATDDDTNDTPSAFTAGSGEEDSVVFGPLDYTMAGSAFSQDVSVTNDSASPAYVRAWIDFDRNGTFDADEVSDEVTVAANAGTTTANVTFNIPANSADTYDGINPGPSFARVIVSDAPGISLSGEGAGEVEDLRVNIADVDICTATSGTTFSAFDFSDFTALPNNARGQTSAVATFRNAAFAPDGTPLDVRVTVNMTSGEIRDFGNGSLNNNVPDSGLYLSITGDPDQDRGEVTLDFFQAYTTTPYAVSGQFATGDIDKRVDDNDPNVTVRLEALLLDIGSFDSYALNTPTTIRSPYVEDNFTVFEGTGDRSNEPDSFVAYEFSDQTSVNLVVRASSKDSATRRAGFGFNGRLASQEFTSSACSAVPPPADYGDAPASYGDAQHAVPQTPQLYLGAVAPDEEEQSLNAANGGADGTGDDLNGTDDEDAFDTLPALSTDSSTYSLDVPLSAAIDGALYGWIDFDEDGSFEASEAATVSVLSGATTATLTWSSANGNAPAGLSEGTTFARLRLTADTLIDDTGTANADERASGAATDGEVEDYTLAVTAPGYGPPFVCDAGLYIVIGDNDPLQSQLYRVNRSVSPYGFTPVGPMTTAAAGGYPNDFRINALAYNPVDNYMYGVISRPQTTETYAQGMIVRIDRNGEMQPIGRAVDTESSVDYSDYTPYAATFTRDGTYIVGGGNRLVAIDIEQATPEVISDVTVSGASFTDFVVDPTDPDANRIYFVNESGAQDRVAFADYTTGTLEGSLPNPTGTNINAGSQFADSFGTIYFRSNSDRYLYRINMDETDTANYGVAERIVQAPSGGQHDGASCAFDVAMEKTVNVTEAQPGDTVSYTYRISNPRSLPVSGLSFDDVVDGGRTFVDGTLSATETSYETGATSSYSVSPNAYGGSDTLTISNLSIPELSVVEITVDVALDTTTSGTLLNQGVLSGLEPSLGSSVNSDYPESPVYGDPTPLEVSNPEADLSLSKEVSNRTPAEDQNATFVEGEEVVFTLTLQNDGPGDATGVEVTDLLPSGLTFSSSIPSQGSYSAGVWNVGTVANGESATLDITATVDTDAPTQITNTAEVTASDQADPDSTPGNRNDEPDEDDTDTAPLSVYRVSPNEGDIVINELLFDQSGTTSAANNDEFVELYNASNTPVNLSNWQLVDANLIANDADGRNGNINGNDDSTAIPYTFPAVQLAPGEYAVIWVGERTATRDVPIAAYQAWLGRSARLSNSGDDMWLYDSEGRIVDYIAYGANTRSETNPDGKEPINTPPPTSLGLWDADPDTYVSLRNTAKGQSISLTPNGVDSNTSACWEPTTSGLAESRCPDYLPTRDSDALVVNSVERVTSVAQNNNAFEKRVTGTVFYDDGLAGGDANNALQEGDERGVPGVVITATDGANTVTTTTDGAGNYNLVIPDTFGDTITLSHSQQPATGYNSGADVTLADAYSDADASSVTFTLTDEMDNATYNFGVVRESTLRPDQSGQVGPGSVISYTHLFTPGTLGEVNLSVSGTYSYQVFRDVDCDGIVQPDEQVDVLAAGFSVDSNWPRTEDGALAPCTLELRVFVPEGEPSGRLDLATLSANLTYANNSDVIDSVSVTDVTTVTTGGRLELTKRIANVTETPTPADSDFSTVGEGEPGHVLEYCITYRNLGTQPLTQTLFSDPIPFFTTFLTGTYGAQDIQWTHDGVATPLSAAADGDEGELNSGVVQVAIGEVAAGESGKVCYRVRIK